MMKRLITLMLIALLLAATCGCVAPATPAGTAQTPLATQTPLTTQTPLATALPLATVLPIATQAPLSVESPAPEATGYEAHGDTYTLTRAVKTDGGIELTLALHGSKDAEYDMYKVSSIDVNNGDQLIQTISVAEAVKAVFGAEDDTDCAMSYEIDCGLTVCDMNFDGAPDIGIIGWTPATSNVPYYYWLWDKSAQQFSYAFCLCNAVVDNAAKQIVTSTKDGAACLVTEYYSYDSQGVLKLDKREIDYADEISEVSEELSAILSDIAESYHPGTAGSSLTAAKYAATLLDFCAERTPEFDNVSAASGRFFFALDAEQRDVFIEQMRDIYFCALDLVSGYSSDLLDSAGYTPKYAPWEESYTESLFIAIYYGMGFEETPES